MNPTADAYTPTGAGTGSVAGSSDSPPIVAAKPLKPTNNATAFPVSFQPFSSSGPLSSFSSSCSAHPLPSSSVPRFHSFSITNHQIIAFNENSIDSAATTESSDSRINANESDSFSSFPAADRFPNKRIRAFSSFSPLSSDHKFLRSADYFACAESTESITGNRRLQESFSYSDQSASTDSDKLFEEFSFSPSKLAAPTARSRSFCLSSPDEFPSSETSRSSSTHSYLQCRSVSNSNSPLDPSDFAENFIPSDSQGPDEIPHANNLSYLTALNSLRLSLVGPDLMFSLDSALELLDDELIDSTWRREPIYQPTNYFVQQREIDPAMRTILIDWLMEVCEEYSLSRECLHLTVNYLDRFLSKNYLLSTPSLISKSNYQLLGITCLFIAAKMEETRPPSAHEFAGTTDGACQIQEIYAMEKEVLFVLEWRLQAQTAVNWVRLFIKLLIQSTLADRLEAIFGIDETATNKLPQSATQSLAELQSDLQFILSVQRFSEATQLVDLALFDLHCLGFYPSAIAATSLIMGFSSKPDLVCRLMKISGYSESVIAECRIRLESFSSIPHRGLEFPIHYARNSSRTNNLPVLSPLDRQVHYTRVIEVWSENQEVEKSMAVEENNSHTTNNEEESNQLIQQ